MGDLSETIEAFRLSAAEGERSHNLWAVASAHTALGVVAMQVNDLTAAAEHLNRAVAMFEAQGDRSSAMNARKFLPLIALADRDFTTARRQTLEALAFYQGTGETLDQFGADQTLATIAMRERNWPAAADPRLRRPGPSCRGSRDRDGPLIWRTTRGASPSPVATSPRRSTCFRAISARLDTIQHLPRYDVRLRLADIYARRRDLAAAEREATSAWDELERWRATLTDRELRLLAFQVAGSENQVSPASVSEQRASVARVLAALATGGRAADAFELAERRRARELRDRMARAQALRTPGPDVDQATTPGKAAPVSAGSIAALHPDRRTAILEYVTGGLGAPTTLFVLTRPSSGERRRAGARPAAGRLARRRAHALPGASAARG